jgi:hypothetical protein
VIRENLDLGRPDQVQLLFGRRVTKQTPGRFRTRVLILQQHFLLDRLGGFSCNARIGFS